MSDTRRSFLKWLAGAVAAVPAVVLGVRAATRDPLKPNPGSTIWEGHTELTNSPGFYDPIVPLPDGDNVPVTINTNTVCEWVFDEVTGTYATATPFKGGGGFFHKQQPAMVHWRDCQEHFAKDVLGVYPMPDNVQERLERDMEP